MEVWDRFGIAIAKESCTYCHGDGSRRTRYDKTVTCNCVYRAAFRACLNRFRECGVLGLHASTVSLELLKGRKGRSYYSRKNEEFRADFCLVSRRVLTEFDHEVFRYHFLFEEPWHACCLQLRIDRGTFFHAVYRIEQQLGRIFKELVPYPLYPLRDYFSGGSGSTPLLAENAGGHVRQIHPDGLSRSFERDQAPIPENALSAGAAL